MVEYEAKNEIEAAINTASISFFLTQKNIEIHPYFRLLDLLSYFLYYHNA